MADHKDSSAKLDALRRQRTLHPHPEKVSHELFRTDEFFEPRDLVQVKYEMLRCVEVDKEPVSRTAAAFGFSRPSFYQAQSAFARTGLAGLLPQKRGPRKGHKLTPEVLEFVERSRAAQPALGSKEIAQLVRERFEVVVHPRSIERKLAGRQKKRR